jgi:hypothetical protein
MDMAIAINGRYQNDQQMALSWSLAATNAINGYYYPKIWLLVIQFLSTDASSKLTEFGVKSQYCAQFMNIFCGYLCLKGAFNDP